MGPFPSAILLCRSTKRDVPKDVFSTQMTWSSSSSMCAKPPQTILSSPCIRLNTNSFHTQTPEYLQYHTKRFTSFSLTVGPNVILAIRYCSTLCHPSYAPPFLSNYPPFNQFSCFNSPTDDGRLNDLVRLRLREQEWSRYQVPVLLHYGQGLSSISFFLVISQPVFVQSNKNP